MNWRSGAEFIGMGGYGLYVWGSLGLMALVMAIEVWQIGARLRALRDSVAAPAEHEVDS